MTRFREWPLTLCLIVAAFAGLYAVSCRMMPVRQLKPYTGTAERNPYLPPVMVEKVITYPAPPMPPGALASPAQTVTKRIPMTVAAYQASIQPAPMAPVALAVQPPKPVTNTLSVDMPLLPNDDHLGRPEYLQVQASRDLTNWFTLAQVPRTNATRIVGNLKGTNPAMFYRTLQTNDWLPPVALPANGGTIGR